MNRLVVHSTTHVIILTACSKIVFCKALTLWIFFFSRLPEEGGKFLSQSTFAVSFKDIHNNIFWLILKSGCLFLSSILPVVCFMVLRTPPYLSYFFKSGAASQLQYVDLFHLLVSGRASAAIEQFHVISASLLP